MASTSFLPPRYCLELPFESEELSLKIVQYLLRRLEKKKDVDAVLRTDLEMTIQRIDAFIFVCEEAVEVIPWKDFVKMKNLIKGVLIPLIKVRFGSSHRRCR